MITLATDCSGIGAPEVALKRLGVPYRYVFASEIDSHAKSILKVSHNPPKIMYGDLIKRSFHDSQPSVGEDAAAAFYRPLQTKFRHGA